jgi:hypothetical protein
MAFSGKAIAQRMQEENAEGCPFAFRHERARIRTRQRHTGAMAGQKDSSEEKTGPLTPEEQELAIDSKANKAAFR